MTQTPETDPAGGPMPDHTQTTRLTRPRARVLIAAALLSVALALAGCGGGSSSPESGASTLQTMVAYAQCMRTHGVPSFPDPTSGGGNSKEAVIRALKQVSNSQVEGAQTACQHLQPNGGRPSRAQLAQRLSDLLAFAGCMRTHGIANFPDPTSSGQVTHEMLASVGISVHQSAVLRAADTCVSVTHGALTKAAVARFAAGH